MFIWINSYSQCYHIDCGCIRNDSITDEMIKLDTSYNYSILENQSEFHTKWNKDSCWFWQKNFKIKKYLANGSIYRIDTLLISEGFVYNSKRNDLWTTYSYNNEYSNSPCYSMINVSKPFYLNDLPILGVCSFSPVDREDILVEIEANDLRLKYPIEYLKDSSEYTTYLLISCQLDSLGEMQCEGQTIDSMNIFKVKAKYLDDELPLAIQRVYRKLRWEYK